MDLKTEHATENAALPHEYQDDAGKCEVCGQPEDSPLHEAWQRRQKRSHETAAASRPGFTREYGS